LAAQSIEAYVRWLATVAERAPNLRNVAVALWAAADWRPDGLPLLVAEGYTDTLQTLASYLSSLARKAEPPTELAIPAPAAPSTIPVIPPAGNVIAIDHPTPVPIKPAAVAKPAEPASEESIAPLEHFQSDRWLTTDADLSAESGSERETTHDSSLPPMPAAPVNLSNPEVDALTAMLLASSTVQRIGPTQEPERYEISRAITGGMGIVYLAYDRLDHRPVALKTSKSPDRAGFEREAHTWIRLGKHPHIVQAFTVQTINDKPHLILEYVGGARMDGANAGGESANDGRTDLRGWLVHGRVDLKLALTVALHVGWALRDAVTRVPTLVHRDLKPENLLLTPDGITKVTDFGLALIAPLVADTPPPSATARIVGTPAYLSPEQAQGLIPDLRSDMYALGVILFELVTGQPLYPARNKAEWIAAHLTGTPHFPAKSAVPEAVRSLTLRLLARQPDRRHSDWASLAADLAQVYESALDQPAPAMIAGEALQMREWMDTAYGLSEIGHHEEALAAYEQALALHPTETDGAWVWARKGRTLRIIGRDDEAIAAFDQALMLNPGYTWARNQRGIALAQAGQSGRALSDFQIAAEKRPGDPWPLLNQADLLEKAGQFTEALTVLDRALVLVPDQPAVQARYGHLLRTLRRYPQALIAYDKAITGDATNTWYWYGKAITLKALDRLNEAVAAFAEAARVDRATANVWAWYAQAEALIALGQDEAALGAAQQATRLFPDHALSWARAGQVLTRLRRYEEALAAYNRSIALDGQNAWAHGGRGEVLERLRRLDEALIAYQTAATRAPNDGWPLLNLGLLLIAMKRPAEAIAAFVHGASLAPTDPRFPTHLARLHHAQGRSLDASEYLERALLIDNRYTPAWLLKGQIDAAAGQYDAALSAYEAAARVRPRDVEPLYEQAEMLLARDRPTEALHKLDQLLALNPAYTRAWIKQAQLWRKLKNYPASLAAADKALTLAPHSTGALLTSGLTLQAINRLPEALAMFEAAARATPANAWAWYNQAVVLIALDRPTPALAILDRALQLDPDQAAGWLMRSQALFKLGRYREALSACDSALGLLPEAPEYWYRRGLILERMERADEALISFERATRFDPAVPLYWTRQVSALLADHQSEQALSLAEQLCQRFSETATVWAELGYVLRRANRHLEAIDAYDRALALDPHYGWAWNGKGQALSALGRWDAAIGCFEQATSEEENDVWTWYNLGKAHFEAGHYSQAVASLERALRVNKVHPPSRRLLTQASQLLHDRS